MRQCEWCIRCQLHGVWVTERDPKLTKLLCKARGYNCTVSCYFLWLLCGCTSALLKSRFFSSFSSAVCSGLHFDVSQLDSFQLLSSATAVNIPWIFWQFIKVLQVLFLHMSCASFCCPLVFVLVTFCTYDYNLCPWSVLQFSEVSLLYISSVVNLYMPCCIFSSVFGLILCVNILYSLDECDHHVIWNIY